MVESWCGGVHPTTSAPPVLWYCSRHLMLGVEESTARFFLVFYSLVDAVAHLMWVLLVVFMG